MYKLLSSGMILRTDDSTYIPKDEGNVCYQAYLLWLEEGNSPLPEFTEEELKAANLKKIADRRFIEETAGMTVSGIPVYTDRTTQMKLTGASLRAERDPNYTVNWKQTTGEFVTLNAAALIALSDKVGDYVQGCYDRESELVVEVLNGTFEESMLDEGWPNSSANKVEEPTEQAA